MPRVRARVHERSGCAVSAMHPADRDLKLPARPDSPTKKIKSGLRGEVQGARVARGSYLPQAPQVRLGMRVATHPPRRSGRGR